MGDPPQGPYGLPPSGQPGPMREGEFTPAARNRDVHFATCEIDPPSPAYIDVDDTFVISGFSQLSYPVLNLNLRILRPTGRIETAQIQFGGGSSGALSTQVRNEREGYLLSATVVPTAAIVTGRACWVMVDIRRQGTAVQNIYRQLIADYITTNVGVSWPERPTRRPTDGGGFIFDPTVASPAAGADWTYTVPTNYRNQVMYFSAQLVTSVAAATRTVTLKIADGANILALIDCPTTQAASLTNQYTGYSGAFVGGTGLTHLYIPLPSPLLLRSGWTLSTVTSNIQAADQWSAIALGLVAWVDEL